MPSFTRLNHQQAKPLVAIQQAWLHLEPVHGNATVARMRCHRLEERKIFAQQSILRGNGAPLPGDAFVGGGLDLDLPLAAGHGFPQPPVFFIEHLDTRAKPL